MDSAVKQCLGLIQAQRFEAAHARAIEMIRVDPKDPAPYFLLAQIASEHQNFSKAEELFARARALAPDQALYLAGLAQFLALRGRRAEALQLADQAAALPMDEALAADTIGVVFSRAGYHEKAIALFERAVELDSSPANFHYNLGASLQFSGAFQRAERAYRAAIERQPDGYRAYSAVVGLSKQTPEENELTELQRLFSQHSADPEAALHLGHAIAKTLEDLERYEESFDWLVRAKRAKREAVGSELPSNLELFAAAAATLDTREQLRTACTDAAPIFIVGLPRTGTTLVDRIVSSHPQVTAAGELNTFADLIKSAAATPSNRVLDAETLTSVVTKDLASVGHEYIEKTRRLTRGAARFTDKMPLNFFYAGLIRRALPAAKIIALRRDPIDSCLSNFRQLFSTGFSYYNYSLDLDDTAAYYQAFDQLLSLWRQALPGAAYMEVRYEDIVHDQEAQTRRLLEFCSLSWDEACMNFHQNAAPVSTASSVQVRQPLYSNSIGRWRRYGSRLTGLRKKLGLQV